MTFLPIVERELRTASRRRSTFGMRVKIAGAAALGVAACALANLIAPSVTFGPSLFWGLSGLCMVYCLFAGRFMTADCLSQEKREGTLGLLFLTDLNGYDIVMGKLAATSLTGFYVLIALLPFLAVPFLAGGMTNGEMWRMELVLVTTFLYSLAIGLFASSISRERRKAMGANLFLLVTLTAGLPAIAGIIFMANNKPPLQELFYCCPVYAFIQCADKRFTAAPGNYWWSLATTIDMTVILTLLACHTAPRSWKDKFTQRPIPQKAKQPSQSSQQGAVNIAPLSRRRLLNNNAYLWLASRPQRKVFYVWALVVLVGCWWLLPYFFFPSIKVDAGYALAGMLNLALKLWITVEAGHQLAEDKKSGAFELLLTTPMTMRDIVRGQWLSLRRQFLGPLATAIIFELVLMAALPYTRSESVPARFIWPAFIVMLVADVITLCLAAMTAALTEKSHDLATLKTMLFVLVTPSLLLCVVFTVNKLWSLFSVNSSSEADWKFYLTWWFGLGLWADSIVFIKAYRRMQARFARNLPESAAPVAKPDSVVKAQKLSPSQSRPLPQKLRRIGVAFSVVVILGVIAVISAIKMMHMDLPKPIIASMIQSNGPVRISASHGFLSILPNGTLWRWGHGQDVSPPGQVGTNNDWVQASVRNDTAVALRSNGTLWAWNIDNEEPKQFGTSHDWTQASAGNNTFIAIKSDGSLWNLADVEYAKRNAPLTERKLLQVGTDRDWKAVCAPLFSSRTALRSDGSLWIWGGVNYVSYGMWSGTNCPAPMRLCRETNFVGFCDGIVGGVRNGSGQVWDLSPLLKRPGPDVSISVLAREVSSNTTSSAFALSFDSNWTIALCETRSDGSLWETPTSWRTVYEPSGLPVRVGERSDWVSVWGTQDTAVALTADGTLWTWGSDYGQPAHYEFVEKLETIREVIASVLGAPQSSSILAIHEMCFPYYPQKTPRPLLQMVFTNSPPNR
ncbi:MAG TPA: ABC transporter permease subunit [Verrucomicrobiae bacterium]